MEVLPSLLAARNFPRLATARMLEPGYRDSPDPSAVAIVFVMVSLQLCVAHCFCALGHLTLMPCYMVSVVHYQPSFVPRQGHTITPKAPGIIRSHCPVYLKLHM